MEIKELMDYLGKLPQDAKIDIEVGESNRYDGFSLSFVPLEYHHLQFLPRGNILEIGS